VSTLSYEAPDIGALDELEDQLTRAFLVIRSALDRGDNVVVVVADAGIQGVGSTAGAALAHGLLGLVRALAVEGRKPGWQINILSVGDGVDAEQRATWIERLGSPEGASGALIRLGDEHLGRVPA
jgi:NAD(P)-dependent dehydrogenase (short-subunit alcohol dehydrogenase family)